MLIPILNRFLHWSVVGVMSSILVLLIISKGIPLEGVGIVMALLSTAVVVFELPSGVLSDLIGRKKIYLISLGISTLGYVVLFFASGFWLVVLGFVLYGISRAFSSGSIEAVYIGEYIAKHGKEKLSRLFTGMSLGETAGLAVGALAGGIMPGFWQIIMPNDNKYNGNLLLQVVILMALGLLTLFHRDQAIDEKSPDIKGFFQESWLFIRSSRLIVLLLLGAVCWGMAFNAIELYWQPQLQSILGSDQDTYLFGLLNSGYFVAALLGGALVGVLVAVTKANNFLVILALRVIMGMLIVVFSFQTGFIGFTLLYLITFFFNGMSGVPENTVYNAEIPEKQRSSLLSLASFVMQIGGILSSLLYSLLKLHVSISVIWIVAGVILMLSGFVYFLAYRDGRMLKVDVQ